MTYAYSYITSTTPQYRQKVVTDARGTTTYAFDVRDRLSSATTTKTGSPTQSVSYNYDGASNRTGVTAQSGTGGSAVYTTTAYAYDVANQLCTAVNTSSATANVPSCGTTNSSTYTFAYDVLGNRTGLTYPNGNGVSVPTDGTGFDALNRTLKLVQTTTSGTTTYSYGYDLNGNKISLNETGGANVGATVWSYDNAQRLTNETRTGSSSPSWNVSYTYYDSDTRHTLSTGGTTITYSANVLDQITSDGSHSFGYDKRGNLVSDGATGNAYAFDAANRMSRALTVSGTTSNTYDADGRRIQQKTGSATTNFLWDCGCTATTNVLLETDVTGAAQARYTVAGGEVVAQTKGSATSYLLHDGQGSVRTLTNASGTITESHVYDAYGALRDPSGSPTTRYLYTGQMLDAGTGLYNLRARYYNTSLGQFLSRDTINDGTNFYGYVHANPINLSDPSGHNAGETATIERAVAEPQKKPVAATGAATAGTFGFIIAVLFIGKTIDCNISHIIYNCSKGDGFGGINGGIGTGANSGNSTSSPLPKRDPSPSSCTQARLDQLEKEKDSICKNFTCKDEAENLGKRNEQRFSCGELRDRRDRALNCIAKRQQIQDECFQGKPDENHPKEMVTIKNGADRCQRKIDERCQ